MTSPPTSNNLTLPGVLVSVHDVGVLIRGESQSGKSELALSLIDRGHALVADDVVECTCKGDALWGQAPALTRGLIEIKDIGVVNVSDLYGPDAAHTKKIISIIIDLTHNPHYIPQDRIRPTPTTTRILGRTLPVYPLHLGPQRRMDILVETLVKNWIIAQSGQDTTSQWLACHTQTLEANS